MTEFTTYTQVRERPEDIPQGIPKECISNALDVACDFGLAYAEGIARGPTIGIWVRHAWNVDDEGNVIDTTWDKPSDCYIGRIIPTREKLRMVVDAGVYLFSREMPLVPEGEVGLDCYTQEQLDFLASQGVRMGGAR